MQGAAPPRSYSSGGSGGGLDDANSDSDAEDRNVRVFPAASPPTVGGASFAAGGEAEEQVAPSGGSFSQYDDDDDDDDDEQTTPSFRSIVPTSAVAVAKERSQSMVGQSLANLANGGAGGMAVQQMDDEDDPDEGCRNRFGHAFLVDTAWFPNAEMLAAYHEYVHPFVRWEKQKILFMAAWYFISLMLALVLGLCAWCLKELRNLDATENATLKTLHAEETIIFTTHFSTLVNATGTEFYIDLESVRFLRVCFAALVVDVAIVGPLVAAALYLRAFQKFMRVHWMDFMGAVMVLLFLTGTLVAVAVLAIFIELVTDQVVPTRPEWQLRHQEDRLLQAQLLLHQQLLDAHEGADAPPPPDVFALSEPDIQAMDTMEGVLLLPTQLSVVFFSVFMFILMVLSLAYINMGFLRFCVYTLVNSACTAVIVAVFLDAASGSERPALSTSNAVVAVVMHAAVVVPAVAAYWVYHSKRMMQFMTTYNAALEHIRLKRPQIVRELCYVDYNSKIGAGGAGQVYRGSYSGHAVAVKEFFSSAVDSKKVDELNREAELWARVNGHPCVAEQKQQQQQQQQTAAAAAHRLSLPRSPLFLVSLFAAPVLAVVGGCVGCCCCEWRWWWRSLTRAIQPQSPLPPQQ
jgi:hypothetical protein